jgi:hypothetical protein|tara:strand:- start:472 stop:720 length:249 start_codon:yes stop_codon:yes gene_type:complete
MDILDDFKESTNWNYFKDADNYDLLGKHEYLTDKERKDLSRLVGLRMNKTISLNEYYIKLSDFWKESGDEEFSNKILLRVKH